MSTAPKEKIAICYYGLTRCTRYVYKSHHANLFGVLRNAGYEVDVYVHTWSNPENYVWGDEDPIPPVEDEYTLLEPREVEITDQALIFSKTIDMDLYNYRYEQADDYQRLINIIYALHSQKKVAQLCKRAGTQYKYIMAMRPDVAIYLPFPLSVLSALNTPNERAVIVSNQSYYGGYCDLFFITRGENFGILAERIDTYPQYRAINNKLSGNPEQFLKYMIDQYFDKVVPVPFPLIVKRASDYCN